MSVWNMSTLRLPPVTRAMHVMAMPSPVGFFSMLFMWWTMMLAMMMPGAFRHLPTEHRGRHSPSSTTIQFWIGYAVIWLGFSIAATLIQYILIELKVLHTMKMWSVSTAFNAALLMIAGLYQLTNIKTQSLLKCQSSTIVSTPLHSGASYGSNCLTSSFPLMLLLFVGGVMNLYWVVLLTLLVTIEKTLPNPKPFSVAIGIACFGTALWALI